MSENGSENELKKIIDDLYNEFNDEKIRLLNLCEKNQEKIKESKKCIEELSKNDDSDFNVFSPRNTKVDYTGKIEQLKKEISLFEEENESIQQKIGYYEERADKLSKIEAMESFAQERTDDSSILMMQELDKQRISRDLHDGIVQNLTHMVHKSELCMKYMDSDLIRAKLEMESIHKSIKDIINELRATIFNLRPMSYDDIGFQTAIEQMMEMMQKSTAIKLVCHIAGNYDNIDDIVLISVVRIVQEATSNAIKYSNAKRITIDVKIQDQSVVVSVEDNGKGIKSKEYKREDGTSGFGISIMKERTKILKGSFQLTTKPHNGTRIYVSIPIIMKGEK